MISYIVTIFNILCYFILLFRPVADSSENQAEYTVPIPVYMSAATGP